MKDIDFYFYKGVCKDCKSFEEAAHLFIKDNSKSYKAIGINYDFDKSVDLLVEKDGKTFISKDYQCLSDKSLINFIVEYLHFKEKEIQFIIQGKNKNGIY